MEGDFEIVLAEQFEFIWVGSETQARPDSIVLPLNS